MDGSAGIPNPYVGPKPFETGEKLFGRDREVAEIGYLLTSERIVLLYAPSGAGKSSLVQAGLLPRLEKKFDCWGITRVGQEPPPGTKNRYVWSTLSGLEKTGAVPPDTALAQYFAQRKKTRNPLIVFDQFEEILRVDPVDIDAKKEYFTQLGELLSDPSVWALFVLREDYLAPLDPYRNMLPTHLQNGYRLDRLTRDAAIDAVVKPVESTARRYAAGVAEKLVENLAGMKVQQLDGSFREESGIYVEPLQLQVVCFDLWERMPKDDLVIEQENVGDIGNALSNYYARAVAAVAHGSEAIERRIREWFQARLITSDGIRNQVRQETGQSGGLDNALVEKLVETYVVRSEPRAGTTWFELAHDRLIRPVQQDNAKWFDDHLSELQKKATLWEEQDRPEGLLWLDAAKLKAAGDTEEEPEKSFLEASRLKQREIRRKQQTAWVLRIVSAAALIAAGFAAREAYRARTESSRARIALAQSQVGSVAESLRSPIGPGVAMAYLASAVQYDPASLGARAWISNLLAGRSWWVPTARLSVAAGKLTNDDLSPDGLLGVTVSDDGVIQLWDAVAGNARGEPMKSTDMIGAVQNIEFSHNSRFFYVTSYRSTQLWDVATRKQVGPTMKYPNPVDKIRLSLDDTLMVTTSAGAQEAGVWSATTGQAVCTAHTDGAMVDADVDDSGDRLVTASNDKDELGQIDLWSVAPGKCRHIRSATLKEGVVGSVRFNRYASLIVTSSIGKQNADGDYENGGVDIWNADLTKGILKRLAKNNVESADFSPTDPIVAGTAAGKAWIWRPMQAPDPNPGTNFNPVILQNASPVWMAVFTDDGKRLITASDGAVQEWEAETGKPIGSPMAVKGHLSGFDPSSDGQRIITHSVDSRASTVWRMESSQSGHGEQVPFDTKEQLLFMANTLSGVRFLVAVTDAQGHTSVCVRDDADRPCWGVSRLRPGWTTRISSSAGIVATCSKSASKRIPPKSGMRGPAGSSGDGPPKT